MSICDCGAASQGKWANIHHPSCREASLDIDTIIEATAASADDRGLKLDPPSTASRVRENAVAHLIFRFLQNCPEDASVMELREAIENCRYGVRV